MTENQWSVIPRHPNPKCSVPEQTAWIMILGDDLPVPEVEYKFDPKRKWRHDFCWPFQDIPDTGERIGGVVLEYDGGLFAARGGHQSVRGFAKDVEKLNESALAGYLVIRFTRLDLDSGVWIDWLRRALKARKLLSYAGADTDEDNRVGCAGDRGYSIHPPAE